MTWNSRPVPRVTPETRAYWSAADDGRLLLRECEGCGLVFHYPRSHCPDCFDTDVSWIEAAGTGEIYSYSVTDQAEDWPEAHLPIVLAYVELDEGPSMMTNVVDADPDEVTVGARVAVAFEPVEDEDVAVPVFVLQ